MSFSGKVKEELSGRLSKARHCCIAELAAFLSMEGRIIFHNNAAPWVVVQTENIAVARKYMLLVKQVFGSLPEIQVRRHRGKNSNPFYAVWITDTDTATRLIQATKLLEDDGPGVKNVLVHPLVIQANCCKRAFIRGAFLAGGSMSDPEKSYHFELVFPTETKAENMVYLMQAFNLDAKVIERKKNYICYLKESGQISDVLSIMEAHTALMEYENVRILKEMRGSINRKVNCETANLNKTISASVEQMNDINYIKRTIGLSALPRGLEEIAEARLAMPDATLKELGEALTTPIGKSGVNHRLRKICNIAENLKNVKEDVANDS